MEVKPEISIVIGSYNRMKYLRLAVQSIREELQRSSLASEIIVVDGGSTDGSLAWLLKQKDVITIVQHNRGVWQGRTIERRSWGYFMNLGFKVAQGKYVCMLSDDCLVVPGAIANGCKLFDERLAAAEKVGAVAFYWRNWPEQKKYWVGKTLGDKLFVNHGLYLNTAIKEAGYIDEENYHFYHADGDFCLKLWRNGYKCIDSPESFIEHFAHANLKVRASNKEKQKSDWAEYLSKWDGIFYDKTKENIGGWVERDYFDPSETAKRYWAKPFASRLAYMLHLVRRERM
jgi:glycosyltransferase involved in cell wall biosynthesis